MVRYVLNRLRRKNGIHGLVGQRDRRGVANYIDAMKCGLSNIATHVSLNPRPKNSFVWFIATADVEKVSLSKFGRVRQCLKQSSMHKKMRIPITRARATESIKFWTHLILGSGTANQ